MATIRHHARIAASAEQVFDAVSDSSNMAEWFPGVVAVTVEDDSRTIDMGGLSVTELIVTNDPKLRRFQYRITDAPMPTESHLATVDVIDEGDGCLLVYSTDVAPDELAGLFDGIVSGAVQALKDRCEA